MRAAQNKAINNARNLRLRTWGAGLRPPLLIYWSYQSAYSQSAPFDGSGALSLLVSEVV